MIKFSKQANRPALYCILSIFLFIGFNTGLSYFGSKNEFMIIYLSYVNTLNQILLCSLPFLGYWAAIKLPNPVNVEDVNLLLSTKDIKVRSYSTKGFIDRNDQISFVRFFFGEDIIYMYFTNYLKIYEGPFYIKEKGEQKIDFEMYYFKSISNFVNEELTLEINPNNLLNPHYKLGLRNINMEDYNLIKKNIKTI